MENILEAKKDQDKSGTGTDDLRHSWSPIGQLLARDDVIPRGIHRCELQNWLMDL